MNAKNYRRLPLNFRPSEATAKVRTLPIIAALLTLLLLKSAGAQNATSMTQVQTVFSRRASGNAFFNRNLRAELAARGLRFTKNPRLADAFLDTSGQALKNGGFVGEMSFIGRGGQVLQREKSVRAPNARAMAFQSLAQKARFKRR